MATPGPEPIQVAIVALPDAVISTLAGVFDVLNGAAMMGIVSPGQIPLQVRIVGEKAGPLWLASGVPVEVQASVDDVPECDIVVVPSILLAAEGWQRDRYPKLVEWAARMHGRGARICSACSGIFLLAETGLLDGRDATVHFGYADAFRKLYPEVAIHPERVLVISGRRDELVSSGASNTWHDLVLYLIAHHVGATVALEVARLFALQWHQDGLTPYMVFEGQSDHGDAEIAGAQEWLKANFSVGSPVEEMIRRSRLAERTFKRRFVCATGLAPIAYVQRLRIEDAKRRLERTDDSVEDISWRVGYEDAAFFRRLFKRTTGMAPGAYRRRFQIPEFARSTTASGAVGRNEPETARPALNSSAPQS
jgi:transcriptional regulator GlxA family with amidase domain